MGYILSKCCASDNILLGPILLKILTVRLDYQLLYFHQFFATNLESCYHIVYPPFTFVWSIQNWAILAFFQRNLVSIWDLFLLVQATKHQNLLQKVNFYTTMYRYSKVSSQIFLFSKQLSKGKAFEEFWISNQCTVLIWASIGISI